MSDVKQNNRTHKIQNNLRVVKNCSLCKKETNNTKCIKNYVFNTNSQDYIKIFDLFKYLQVSKIMKYK